MVTENSSTQKKKVLIITYYWPPSGGAGVQRVLKFIKYLPDFDIVPVVLTVENPTYSIKDESLATDVPDDLAVYRARSFEPFQLYGRLTGQNSETVSRPTTRLGRTDTRLSQIASWIRANIFIPDARLGWVPGARKRAVEIIEQQNVDTVITSGPPHSVHLIGKYVQRKRNVRWIADFRDPWSRVYYNQFLPRTYLAGKVDLALERSVLRNADEVIVISPGMQNLQKEVVNRPYRLITNGFDHEDFIPAYAADRQESGPFTIRHIGSISEPSIPAGLFRAFESLSHIPEWRVEMIGHVHPDIHMLIKKHGLEKRVSILPYLPHDLAIRSMCTADLLLLIIPDTEQNDLIVTGKLFEYIGSGKPVMLIGPVEGDAAGIIRDYPGSGAFEHREVDKQCEFLKQAIRHPASRESPGYDDLKHHTYSRYRLTKILSKLIRS